MALDDEVHFGESVSAGLDTTEKAPNVPCPKCGKETKSCEEAFSAPESRICSSVPCRAVQSGIVEQRVAGRPRFPCGECGKETKTNSVEKPLATLSRICSNRSCRHTFLLS